MNDLPLTPFQFRSPVNDDRGFGPIKERFFNGPMTSSEVPESIYGV
jgi:hypothetical protein